MGNMRNQIQLIGHLGQDPELKRLESGRAVIRFSMATTEKWRDKVTDEIKEETTWHTVKAWGTFGEILFEKLRKGNKVVISGTLKYDKFEKEGVKQSWAYILADSFEKMTQAEQSATHTQQDPYRPATETQAAPLPPNSKPDYDDLPF